MTIPITLPDLNVFFQEGELAQFVSLDRGDKFLAIFTEFYDALEVGFSDVDAVGPMFICKTSEVAGVKEGSGILLAGSPHLYTVREIRKSNAGLTRLRAERGIVTGGSLSTMWVPHGLSYSHYVDIVPFVVDNQVRRIYGGAIFGFYISEANRIELAFIDIDGITQIITGPVVVSAKGYSLGAVFTPNGTTLTVGSLEYVSAIVAASNLQDPVSSIGSLPNGDELYYGLIRPQSANDLSPFQRIGGRPVNRGNAVLSGLISEPIEFAGDFSIRAKFERRDQDGSATGKTSILSLAGDEFVEFAINDSTNIEPGAFIVSDESGVLTFDDALAHVNVGQHAELFFERVGGVKTISFDGVKAGELTSAVYDGPVSFDIIGADFARAGAYQGIYAEFEFRDLSTGLEWDYIIDDGAGVDLVNSGSNTQGNYLNLPIYNTWVNVGNNALYGLFPIFIIPAGDSYSIEWSGIRHDRSGTTTNAVVAEDIDSFLTAIRINDSNNVVPGALVLRYGVSQITIANAMEDIAIGDRYKARLIVESGISTSGYVNEVFKGSGGATDRDISLGRIGRQASQNMPNDVVYQELKIHNITTGRFVEYRLNEETGAEFLAYDINGDKIPNGPELWDTGAEVGGDGWSTNAPGDWSCDGSQVAISNLECGVVPVIGDSVKFTVSVSEYGGGGITAKGGGINGARIIADGEYEFILLNAVSSEAFQLQAESAFIGRVSLMSVKITSSGAWTQENKVFIPEFSHGGLWSDENWQSVDDVSIDWVYDSELGRHIASDKAGNPQPKYDIYL